MAILTQSVRNIGNSYNYTYTCEVTENSVNNATNTSNVTITFKIKGGVSSGNQYSGYNENWGIYVNGSLKNSGVNASQTLAAGVTKTIGSWTGDVTHNSDGSLNMPVSVYLWHGISSPNTNSFLPVQYQSSAPLAMGSVPLTNIARGLVYIDNGSGFEQYQVYIDNGTSWEQYAPYIDSGSAWGLYS